MWCEITLAIVVVLMLMAIAVMAALYWLIDSIHRIGKGEVK